MSNIKITRLSTGEELISNVETQSDGYLLKDIAILIPTQANSLGLAPFMAYGIANNGIFFKDKDIMFMIDPVDGLKQQYQTMFGHVITPPTSIIS